jgi:hypothetical protein
VEVLEQINVTSFFSVLLFGPVIVGFSGFPGERNTMFDRLFFTLDLVNIDTNLLLSGNNALPIQTI